ncbi:hypothetical protein ACFLR4_04685 [Bacteroidota bacterium]
MKMDVQKYKDRHLAFWELADVKSPLIGFALGAGTDAWSYWQANKAAQILLNNKIILPAEIEPADFVEEQIRYLELADKIDDDVIRTGMPLASLPWMEAILGCKVISTGAHFQSHEILDDPELLQAIPFDDNNPWVKKYFEFIDVYSKAFGNRYPVAQSVLRGPSDLACALLGAEKAAMSLIEAPEVMHRLFDFVTSQIERFLKLQIDKLPTFSDGYVTGQYEIWAPKPVIRIQEDFSILFSPKNYKEFLQPLDKRLAALSDYTLIHLHSSSLYLIEQFLEISEIKVFQITKDPTGVTLDEMLPALKKIQESNRPLIVKGEFTKNDIDNLKQNFSTNGLCLQPVVSNINEAKELLLSLRKWK